MDLQTIYSPLYSTGRVKVIKRQQGNPQERGVAKEFRKGRKDKKKKKKEDQLSLLKDRAGSVENDGEGYENKRHPKKGSMNEDPIDYGGLIDIKI